MRVAVLMSGQLRGWEVAKDNQRWFWSTSGAEVDYFVHTWTYSADRTGVSQPYVTRDVTGEEFDRFLDAYKPVKYILDDQKQVDMYHNDHWLSLFYSFCQTLIMKREYELENDFQYDAVIKTRPDIVFDPERGYTLPFLHNNQLFTTHGQPMPAELYMQNFNDIVFLGNSYSMDLLINIFNYRKYNIHPDCEYKQVNVHPLGPGTLMNEYFGELGITPFFNLPFKEIIIKDGHPEGLDLFKVEDFKQMRDYFFKWYTK